MSLYLDASVYAGLHSIIAQPIESQGNKKFFSTAMQGNYAGFAGVDIFKAGNDASFSRDRIKRAKYRISAVGRREGSATMVNGSGDCKPARSRD